MINKPNFKEFRSFGSRLSSKYIGITRNGSISLYSGFYKKNSIGQFSHCIILYDKVGGILGVQFGGTELGDGAFVVSHNKKRGTANISAQNFFKMNEELALEKCKGKYTPEKYNDEARKNVFVINLNSKL